MNIATAAKEVICLGLEIRKTIEKVRINKRRVIQLSADITRDLVHLESLFQDYSFTNCHELLAELDRVKLEMNTVQTLCGKLIMTDVTHQISKAKAKIKAWYKRDSIEVELLQLRDRLRDCLSKFTTFSVARIEHRVILQGMENRVRLKTMDGLLQTYLTETHKGRHLVRQMDISLATDDPQNGIEFQYFSWLVARLLEGIQSLASSQQYKCLEDTFKEEPDSFHRCRIMPFPAVQEDFDSVVGRVLGLLRVLQYSEHARCIQESAFELGDLSVSLSALRLGAVGHRLRAWSVYFYRALATQDPFFLPHLAFQLANSYDPLNNTRVIEESYAISTSFYATVSGCYSSSLHLHILNTYTFHLQQTENWSEALAIAETAYQICRELWTFPLLEQEVDWSSVDKISTTFYNLISSLSAVGQIDRAQSVAEEILEIFRPFPTSIALESQYIAISLRISQSFIHLSAALRDIGRGQEAYEIAKQSFEQLSPLVDSPLYHWRSFQVIVEALRSMYNQPSLQFDLAEDFVLAFHAIMVRNPGDWVGFYFAAIYIYASRCLQFNSEKYSTSGDLSEKEEIWDKLIKLEPSGARLMPDLIWSQLSDFGTQFLKFLSENPHIAADSVRYCLSRDFPTAARAVVRIFFTWDAQRSVASVQQASLDSQELESETDFLRSLYYLVGALGSSGALHQLAGISTRVVEDCKFHRHSNLGEILRWHSSIMAACGYHREALEIANEAIQALPIGSWEIPMVFEICSQQFTALDRPQEAVESARKSVLWWKEYAGDSGSSSLNYAYALDFLSSKLKLAGDEFAEKVRAEADRIWADYPQYVGARETESPAAHITEVIEVLEHDCYALKGDSSSTKPSPSCDPGFLLETGRPGCRLKTRSLSTLEWGLISLAILFAVVFCQ
ncbi:hypothetical protein C8J56DRAFT_928952 [Mycena floridula]|nr:hypothetical protein C8J56DRAFT_928952 [Mycena floridula]